MLDIVIYSLAVVIGVLLIWRFIAGFLRTIRRLGTAKTPSGRKWICLKLSGYSFLSASLIMLLALGTTALNYVDLVTGFLYTAMLVSIGALFLFFTGYMVLNLARAYWAWREEKASAGRGMKRD